MNPFQKIQDYILESWLPTKLSILIAGSSIPLAALSVGLPEFLQKIMEHPLQPEKTLLFRLVVPLVILYLGTFIVLILVVKHYKKSKSIKNKPSLSPYFNLLWDTMGNIYCPKCEIMLADSQTNEQITHYINRSSFQCPECKQPYLLKDVHGEFLRKSEAFYLKNKNIKSKFNALGVPNYVWQYD